MNASAAVLKRHRINAGGLEGTLHKVPEGFNEAMLNSKEMIKIV
jgi:hypothetical protein